MRNSQFLRFFKAHAKKFPLPPLVTLSRQKLIMPFYHSVSNEYLPHLSNLYNPKTSREFEKDLDFLLKHYKPVDLNYIYNLSSVKSKKPAFFLSFDDGLKEVHSMAAPILKRKGVPATIFVNSAFVDNKAIFFRYKASLLIDAYQKKKLSEIGKRKINKVLGNPKLSDLDVQREILKLQFHQQEKLDELANILEVDFSEYLKTRPPYLSSAEIKELQSEGHSIGAHSIDHPEFRFIHVEEQIRQAVGSLKFVKENFNPPIFSFSFPFTDFEVRKAFFQELEELKICDLTFGCAGLKHDPAPNHFQRIPLEDFRGTAEEAIKFEYLYFILKSFLRKNTTRRK